MKILYDITTGVIFYAVPDRDWFYFKHSTNTPLTELRVDELEPDNKEICIDLLKTAKKKDSEGDGKYKVINGEVHEKEGWQEDSDAL